MNFFLVLILITFINFYYFTHWLYAKHNDTSLAPAPSRNGDAANKHSIEEEQPKVNFIKVSKGEKVILMPLHEIAYAYIQDSYCYIKKQDEEMFVTTYALDDIAEIAGKDDFFRANRQVLVNRRALKAYSSIEYGKIALELVPVSKEKIIVSQKRAKLFREWINKHNSHTRFEPHC